MFARLLSKLRPFGGKTLAAGQGKPAASVLISCHIGKTGGTSIRQMLQAVHGADRLAFLTRPPGSGPIPRSAYPMLPAHYGHALSIDSHDLRYVPPAEFWPGARFLTALREPVETFFSGYYFVRYHIGRRLGDDVSEEQRERWLDENYPSLRDMSMIFANNQTRFIVWKSFYEPADMDDLDTAKTELEKYDIIVLNEKLDEASALIANYYPEFEGAQIRRENVTPGRNAGSTWADRVPPADLNWVKDLMRPDLALYEHALAVYEQRKLQ